MNKGFIIIELLIIIAIIAIIAAIAIPSLMQSKMASQETAVVKSLKSLAPTEAVWYSADIDRNNVKDYWVIDVSGLYRVIGADGLPVKTIPIDLAKADYNPTAANVGNIVAVGAILCPANTPIPRQGYYYAAFLFDFAGNALAKDHNGDGDSYENVSQYAFQCFPAKYNINGKQAYIMNESNTVYRIDAITAEGAGGANATKRFNNSTTFAPSCAAPVVTMIRWPSATPTDSTVGYSVD